MDSITAVRELLKDHPDVTLVKGIDYDVYRHKRAKVEYMIQIGTISIYRTDVDDSASEAYGNDKKHYARLLKHIAHPPSLSSAPIAVKEVHHRPKYVVSDAKPGKKPKTLSLSAICRKLWHQNIPKAQAMIELAKHESSEKRCRSTAHVVYSFMDGLKKKGLPLPA